MIVPPDQFHEGRASRLDDAVQELNENQSCRNSAPLGPDYKLKIE